MFDKILHSTIFPGCHCILIGPHSCSSASILVKMRCLTPPPPSSVPSVCFSENRRSRADDSPAHEATEQAIIRHSRTAIPSPSPMNSWKGRGYGVRGNSMLLPAIPAQARPNFHTRWRAQLMKTPVKIRVHHYSVPAFKFVSLREIRVYPRLNCISQKQKRERI